MTPRRGSLVAVALLTACSHAPAQSLQVSHQAAPQVSHQQQRLCDALSEIGAGERRRVTLSGIYAVGPEHATFYDPNELSCRVDVQPQTWVEFAPKVRNEELERIIATQRSIAGTRRAHVTFTGDLYGPGAVAPDDRSFPQMTAFANRVRNRRYGHLNAYRTKLLVMEVSDVRSVPDSAPWPANRSLSTMPVVERAEVPRYPQMAWNVGITGDVVLDVTVTDGRVSKAEVRSGDRMLSDEAVRNVQTWQFAPATNATFTTTFTYDVEHRLTGADRAPRIELRLPTTVHITAASNDW